MKSSTLQDAVTECVDRYISGDWSRYDCFDKYPEWAPDISSYLSIVDSLNHLPVPMTAKSLRTGEMLLSGELSRMQAPRSPSLTERTAIILDLITIKTRLAVVSMSLVLAILAGSSVTLAATISSPNSPLYDYKLALEQAQIELASESTLPALHMEFADRRLREMKNMETNSDPILFSKVSNKYKSSVESGLDSLNSLAEAPTYREESTSFELARKQYIERLDYHSELLVVEATKDSLNIHKRAPLTEALAVAVEALVKTPTKIPVQPIQQLPDELLSPKTFRTPALLENDDASVQSSLETDITNIPTPIESEFKGTLTAVGTEALMVDGRRVFINSNSPRPQIIGVPIVGSPVVVIGHLQSDGTLLALKLTVGNLVNKDLVGEQLPIAVTITAPKNENTSTTPSNESDDAITPPQNETSTSITEDISTTTPSNESDDAITPPQNETSTSITEDVSTTTPSNESDDAITPPQNETSTSITEDISTTTPSNESDDAITPPQNETSTSITEDVSTTNAQVIPEGLFTITGSIELLTDESITVNGITIRIGIDEESSPPSITGVVATGLIVKVEGRVVSGNILEAVSITALIEDQFDAETNINGEENPSTAPSTEPAEEPDAPSVEIN